MKNTIYFPEGCQELLVTNVNSLPENVLNTTHNVSNRDLVNSGKCTWVNGYTNGFVRGIIATLIPVAGIAIVQLIKRHYDKEKEGK